MLKPIHVYALTVTSDQAREFLIAIENAIRTMTEFQLQQIYFLNHDLQAIHLSYDGEYRPFIGFTAGFNYKDDRVYLSKNIWLLIQIGKYLKELNLSKPGGRVFINSYQVKRRSDDYRLHDLCCFEWEGEDVWQKCQKILKDAKHKAYYR